MRHLDPTDAYQYLQQRKDALFVDCRTEMEYLYVGHPLQAVHIAWQEYPDFASDAADFSRRVLREAGSAARPVVLICRSGVRTVEAAAALEAAGFTEVVNVVHGFEGDLDARGHRNTVNGWRKDGLPWEQM
jgi:rhodanese-related sulfurtransferase